MSTHASAQTRRNRIIAIIGVALLGVSIVVGPSGLLVARTTECVWEICVSNALMYGVGGFVLFFVGLNTLDGILVKRLGLKFTAL